MNITEDILLNDKVTEFYNYGAMSATASTSAPATPVIYNFTNGTSTAGTIVSVIDLSYEKANASAITLAASASTTLILSALTDDQGRAVAFVRLRKFLLHITAKTGNDYLTIAPGGTHGLANFGTVPRCTDLNFQVWDNPAGLVIASGSLDQIIITNNGSASITFDLRIDGCST